MYSNRNDFFRRYVDLSDKGIEIGPSFNPIFPKSMGYNCKIIDKYTKDEIIKLYKVPHLKDKIEEVDYIHEGSDLQSIFNNNELNTFNYIASSHNLEHLINIVKFFIDCQNLLRENGLLLLNIPDKRYCFDFFRTISTLKDVLIQYVVDNNDLDFINLLDASFKCVRNNNNVDWLHNNINPNFTFSTSINLLNDYNFLSFIKNITEADKKDSPDFHRWCFTPSSFAYLIRCLATIKLINFEVQNINTGVGCSILVILRKTNTYNPLTDEERLGYQFAIYRDLQVAIEFLMTSSKYKYCLNNFNDKIINKLLTLSSQELSYLKYDNPINDSFEI